MTKASKSGLFEVWGGMVIEGDMVTRTSVRFMLLGIFDTSEAIEKATESNEFDHFEYLEVRPPAAYLARHKTLENRKRAREAAVFDSSIPF